MRERAERDPPASGGGQRATATLGGVADLEQAPRLRLTRPRIAMSVLFVAGVIVLLYLAVPKLVGLGASIRRLQGGDGWWLAAAAGFEALSFVGYVLLFRTVFVRGSRRIGWRASYEITMAGLAATRLLAAGGAGGIALTAWALRRSGMESRLVASRMVAFMALLYGVYMSALLLGGLGLYLGLWSGAAPFAITIVPALFGALAILIFLAISALPDSFERFVAVWSAAHTLSGRIARRLALAPSAAAAGVRTGIELLRTHDPGLLGALAWWGFDIATLWACFHAFGAAPPKAVIVMAYFVGWLANTLPLPGGIGGVEGGMIGAFTAFNVGVQSAVAAVLAYRAFSFWLPTLPGGIAYLQLHRRVKGWREEQAAAQ